MAGHPPGHPGRACSPDYLQGQAAAFGQNRRVLINRSVYFWQHHRLMEETRAPYSTRSATGNDKSKKIRPFGRASDL